MAKVKNPYSDFNYAAHVADCHTRQFRLIIDEETGEEVMPWNEKLVETAGFVPLEVRFKQMEQNGLMAQFQLGELSPEDLRQIYLSEEFEIKPDDELEDALDKVARRTALQQLLIEERKKAQTEQEAKAPHVLTAEEYAQFKALAAQLKVAPPPNSEQQ